MEKLETYLKIQEYAKSQILKPKEVVGVIKLDTISSAKQILVFKVKSFRR